MPPDATAVPGLRTREGQGTWQCWVNHHTLRVTGPTVTRRTSGLAVLQAWDGRVLVMTDKSRALLSFMEGQTSWIDATKEIDSGGPAKACKAWQQW
eukprot:12554895-Prorocentrum_lima.AAC.1